LFWLSAGLLYTLEKSGEIVVAVVAGIAVVIGLRVAGGLTLPIAQILGILLASLIGFAAAALHLRRRARPDTLTFRPQSLALDLSLAWPYFLFGTFYYLFLFSDRLLAWSASTFGAPLSLQFRGAYETALDIALIAFVLQVGWVLPASLRFARRVLAAQTEYGVGEEDEHNAQMTRWYWRALLGFVPVAVASAGVAYCVAAWWGLLDNETVYRTAVPALAGYPLLVIGLFNATVFFRLSRANAILKPILAGVMVNVTAGYLLSRLISFEWAVIGFLAGGACFALLSTWRVRRHLRQLDYYYYASGV
jgi:hypothetical protein